MKNSIFFTFGIGAVLITTILYLIDSDPAYNNFKTTAIEFLVISLFFFSLFFGIRAIITLTKNKKIKMK